MKVVRSTVDAPAGTAGEALARGCAQQVKQGMLTANVTAYPPSRPAIPASTETQHTDPHFFDDACESAGLRWCKRSASGAALYLCSSSSASSDLIDHQHAAGDASRSHFRLCEPSSGLILLRSGHTCRKRCTTCSVHGCFRLRMQCSIVDPYLPASGMTSLASEFHMLLQSASRQRTVKALAPGPQGAATNPWTYSNRVLANDLFRCFSRRHS